MTTVLQFPVDRNRNRTTLQAASLEAAAHTDTNTSSIVDLASFKARKELRGPRKLAASEMFAKDFAEDEDFSARIERIKASISRINNLMFELRSMSDSEPAEHSKNHKD